MEDSALMDAADAAQFAHVYCWAVTDDGKIDITTIAPNEENAMLYRMMPMLGKINLMPTDSRHIHELWKAMHGNAIVCRIRCHVLP